MGKRKGRGGGLGGLSRFVLEVFKTESASTTEQAQIPDGSAEPPASKKRRTNSGEAVASITSTSAAQGEGKSQWIKKYDASGLVPHCTDASQLPEHLQKYFSQRTRFFSLYSISPGCLLDEEGWFSVTPELVADQIAERCRCDTILDAFCGVGGNAIAFAKTCQRVIALDTSPTRLALARHNAQIYGVADRIEFILTDYISFAESYLSLPSSTDKLKRRIDVVFLSPPWGGPSYLSGALDSSTKPSSANGTASNPVLPPDSLLPKNDSADPTPLLDLPPTPTPLEDPLHPSYSLAFIQPIPGPQLFKLTRQITRNVAFYVPRNTRLEEVSALLTAEGGLIGDKGGNEGSEQQQEQIEIEEEWMGNKLKALTCYFGGLVDGQGDLF